MPPVPHFAPDAAGVRRPFPVPATPAAPMDAARLERTVEQQIRRWRPQVAAATVEAVEAALDELTAARFSHDATRLAEATTRITDAVRQMRAEAEGTPVVDGAQDANRGPTRSVRR